MQQYIAGWLSHRKAFIDLVGTFEDKHLTYKPWEKGMSTAGLILHVVGAMRMFASTVKNGTFTPPPKYEEVSSAQELRDLVRSETALVQADLEAIPEANLGLNIEIFGSTMPGIAILGMAKDHEIHHKGQLFTYARLLGIENVPFFMAR